MIKVFLNNVEISQRVEVDLSFVEKLDMELDEAFLIITHTDRPTPYDMFSNIDIYEDNTLLFSGKISNDDVSLSSYSDLLYNHNVSVIEHTKILEKYIVTGKTFTQPIDNSTIPFYTLYDVLDILSKTTVLKLFGEEEINKPYEIPENLKTELETIISPEFTFKDVTLRQAVNEVFSYLDGIARLDKNGNLLIERFNDLKNEVEFLTENYKTKQNIQNYSTIMSSDLINSVNTGIGFSEYNSEYYPGKTLWTTLRSNELTQFDFLNSFIPTPKPIYKVEEVWTEIDLFVEKIDDGLRTTVIDSDRYPVDFSSNVVEKNLYETLTEEEYSENFQLTKRNTVYYEYGNKNIGISETFGVFDLNLVIERAITNGTVEFLVNEGILPSGGTWFPNLARYYEDETGTVQYNVQVTFNGSMTSGASLERWDNLFRVKYVPILPSIRYEVVRDDISEVFIDTKSIANQKLRIVDLERFTNNMKGRINQLGNSDLILSHKVSSINQTFNVGDFTPNNFIITKKEVIVQRDHYIVNYELNKNFNKMSQFMGIDQEIRQYEISERGRTLDRDLNFNQYVEVYADNEGTSNNGNTLLENSSDLLKTLDSSYGGENYVKYGVFTSPETVNDIGNQIPIVLSVYKVSGGNAFGFYTDFIDNVSAGNKLEIGDDDWFNFAVERRYNVPLRYTNDFGRFKSMLISLHDGSTLPETTYDSEVEAGNKLPEFFKNFTSQLLNGSFYVEKDNRERIKLTMLYHVLSKDLDEVVIGERFVTNNSYFIESSNNIELRIWNDKRFIVRDKNQRLTGEALKISNPSLTFNYEQNYFEVPNDVVGYDAWALTDNDGYPYIMVNSDKKRIVFEFNKNRGEVDYGGEVEPERLERPNVISSSATSNSVTFSFGNPNNEDVTISVTLNEETKTELVDANQSSGNITFTGLEPNLSYIGTVKSVPLETSEFIESDTRTIRDKTDIIPIDAPIFVLDSVQNGDLVDREYIGGTLQFYSPEVTSYIVNYKVFNGNDEDVQVFAELDGQDVTPLSDNPTFIPANGNAIYSFKKKYSDPIDLVPDPDTITGNTRIMPERDYPFRFRLRTTEYTNNWFSPYSVNGNINVALPSAVTPTPTWIPTATENELIFNLNNEQSYDVACNLDLRYNGTVVKSAINVQVDANTDINFTFTNTPTDNIPNSLDAFNEFEIDVIASATGFNDGSRKYATGRFAGEAKPPTYQFISKTSTNSTSSFTYKLTNIERYQGRIYYEANTFDGNFTPTNYEIVGAGQSITKTFDVPANNINDDHYVHFYMAEDGPLEDIPEVISDSVIVVSPSITPEPYIDQFTVRFLDIDGNVIDTVLKDDGESLQIGDFPGAPSESGYTFIDWYDSAQLTNVVTTGYTITNNLDIYPRYDIITYNIAYELDGATNDAANPNTYTVEDSFTLQPATRDGYEFDGWYSDSLLTSEVTQINEGTTGNLTLYAKLNRLFLEDVTFALTNSTSTSLTVTATNPANQRTDASVGVGFGLQTTSGQLVDIVTNYIFSGPSDTVQVVFDGLDDGVTYEVFGQGPNDEIIVYDNNNIYDDLLLNPVQYSTPAIIGDKTLEVILNTGGLGSTSGTFNYNVNGVPQSGVTVNNSSYTTIRSNLFDDDLVHLFAPNLSGFSFSNFIINGQQFNDQSPEVLVDTGLTVEIVYT